ncbi:Ca(2+)-dependent cysteine protease [Mucor velutinosus]|uniref:Ca(2+)-dependent cysteine protease n=1 Tax=Mucor velutinosus TaxID=708070 RepID=A0AAN7HTQ7_9FUNG|nr:Ca(2+)-dependent cysteine protease [Mucor velutinosus]
MLFKNHLIPTSILLLSPLCFLAKADFVVIECNFPCAESGDVCQVTDAYVQCKPRTDTTRWVLKDTMSLPEYQGSLIPLGQPCMTAPQPKLRDASHLSKNTSETCLEWPPNDDYDSYYSNCAHDLYCDRAHICVKQLAHGEVCESDNQCLDGNCNNHTCVEKVDKASSNGSNTAHIIASVIGVALFLAVVFCIYYFRRRRLMKKRLLVKQQELDKEQPEALPKTTTSAIRSNSSSSNTTTQSTSTASSATLNNSTMHPSINMLHPAYDSHFQQDSSRTPSMQQQQLQYQLQRQILFNKTNNSSTQNNPEPSTPLTPPPPPYSP